MCDKKGLSRKSISFLGLTRTVSTQEQEYGTERTQSNEVDLWALKSVLYTSEEKLNLQDILTLKQRQTTYVNGK